MPKLIGKNATFDEFRMIDLVKSNPELYDPSHEFAKDIVHKNNIWKKIAGELNVPVEAPKNVWKRLRYAYARGLRYPEGKKSGSRESLPYDNALSFMKKFIMENSRENSCASSECNSPKKEKRFLRSGSHVSSGSKKETISSPSNIPAGNEDPVEDNPILTENPVQNNSGQTGSEASDRYHAMPSATSRVLRPRMSEPSRLASKEALQKATNTASRRLTMTPAAKNRRRNSPNPDDPTRAFFESMALTVASFPQHLQATIKVQVCNIVAETEYDLSSPKIR
ncbi:uncharacterized protein LOC112494824 [Cephus cinctus]|uniref:Uncharacterized protein LOC112494824 n=1 Tax=Cephus cinctus TaxID=211228 RepID=A0AAJ7W484_CEPCN|nr:uncharacterized protein LOC112494824 [Cephus cinctus]